MITFIMVIHVIVCIMLIAIILIQTGRGGGLVEGFSGIESMFGTKTSSFLVRSTSILASLFIITCLSLAVLSARQHRSLMKGVIPTPQVLDNSQAAPQVSVQQEEAATQQAPVQESPKQ